MIVGVTGHRKFEHSTVWVYERVKSVFAQLCPTEVVTGMAIGFDQLVADVCLEMGIPFIAAVPFIGQELTWPAYMKAHYGNLMAKASKVVIVNDGGWENWKFLTRNKWIANNTEVMVSYLPKTTQDSGTKHCSDYAMSIGRRVVNVGTLIPQDTAGLIKVL